MIKEDMIKWNAKTTSEPGLQKAVSPDLQECEYTHIDRLNLVAGQQYTFNSGEYEMFIALISGKGHAKVEGVFDEDLNKLDACYLAGNTTCLITATEDCSFYVAYAKYEGIGSSLYIRFNKDVELGRFKEVHGEGVFRREVILMLDEKTPASRMMCGYTFGADAGWTSWPPHEHADTLEETYCYFDMPAPQMGFQLTYLEENGLCDCVVHPVREGNMVVFPTGYHPTVSTPGTCNNYMWVLVPLKPEFRKFGVYNKDKNYDK